MWSIERYFGELCRASLSDIVRAMDLKEKNKMTLGILFEKMF